MSHNPGQSDAFARLFFYNHELFPDPLARGLLPYLPESKLYFDIVDREIDGLVYVRVHMLIVPTS